MRIELFGDEVESMRWFSTFTQRSLGEAERVELAPAAELDAEHRELAELAAMEAAEEGERARRAWPRCCRWTTSGAPLDLVPDDAAVVLAAAEEIEPALRDHWEDATTAMHADDARHLYVDVAEPLAARAALSLTGGRRGRRGRLPRRPRRVAGAQRQGGRGRAGETGPLRLPHRRRLRQPRRGRARPLRPRPPRRRACSKAAASRPTRASPSPRRACARASSAPS